MGDDSTRTPATGYPVHSANPYPPSTTPYAYPPPPQTHQQQHPNPSNPYFNNNNSHPYHQQQQPNYAQRTSFIRRFVAGMIAVFIIIGCIFFITWIVLRPKFPEFTVESASITGFNLSNSAVSGSWDFKVTTFNPNKKVNIVYQEIESNLAYKSNSIADSTLAPFAQGKRVSTQIRVVFAANGAYLKDKVAAEMSGEGDRGGNGIVGFEVRIYARVVFDAGIWRIRRRLLRVLCDNVMINIGSNGLGNMTGGAKGCRVGW